MNVSLRSTSDDYWGYGAVVRPDGTFEIKAVDDGDYAVVLHAGESGWFVKSAKLGPDDVLSDGLHVEKGNGGNLQIVLTNSGAELEGSVIQDDKPAVGVRVRIVPDPETPYNRIRRDSTTTDQNGHFLFIGVPGGKYRVSAKAPPEPGTEVAKADAQVIALAEREHKAIDLKLVAPKEQ
jgi:hypothetical protein